MYLGDQIVPWPLDKAWKLLGFLKKGKKKNRGLAFCD
jgi:hypothetical protein